MWTIVRVLTGVVTLVLVAAGVAHASIPPSGARRTSAAGDVRPAKIPPVPTIPTSGPGIDPSSGLGGVAEVQGNGENLATKTLTVVHLPPLQVYAYPVKANVPDPAFPGFFKQVAEAWIISNPTPADGQIPPYISYGAVPTVHVSTLAFGAIPITADITLSQTVGPDGLVDPLVVDYSSAHFTFTASGSLTFHLSDVAVDGVALNVAPTCTTVSPAILVAHAQSDPSKYPYYSISQGGTLTGSVTIPRFTGCIAHVGSGASEDIGPLLDGTISGTSNPTYLTQSGLGYYDPAKKNDCYVSPPRNYPYRNGCQGAPAVPTITPSMPVPTVTDPGDYDPPAY